MEGEVGKVQIFVCVDDNGGMLFNNRRQSKDGIVIEKVREITGSHKLWIRNFSRKLFVENVTTDDDMLMKAKAEDYCFVEDVSLSEYADRIDAIYIFRWNRKYPSDFKFNMDLEKYFHLEKAEEFTGSSHEKITLERWIR